MRIRSLLVLMAVAILLPVVLAAGIALDQIREGERAAALRGLRETARATSLIVDREVQGSLSALKALSHSRSLQQGDLAGLLRRGRRHQPVARCLDPVDRREGPAGSQHDRAVRQRAATGAAAGSCRPGRRGSGVGQAGGQQPAGGPGDRQAPDHRRRARAGRSQTLPAGTGLCGGPLEAHRDAATVAGRLDRGRDRPDRAVHRAQPHDRRIPGQAGPPGAGCRRRRSPPTA